MQINMQKCENILEWVQKKVLNAPSCVPREARTLDPLIKSQLLYQLS